MTATKEPVDAVITWVDGNDKAHAEKLARHFASLNMARPVEADPCRYQQCGEIAYCVASLLRFAPWIRHIFIVTDAQTPPIIAELQNTPYADKIKLIDHRDIFHGLENCIPNFNSLAIESVLWRIPELAERFIYLNDDFFFIRPVEYEQFFHEKGLVLRGSWKTILAYKWSIRLKQMAHTYLPHHIKPPSNNAHRALQERTAQLAGFQKKFFHLPHAPLALQKSTLASFFNNYPELLQENAAFRVRNAKQFWPISLAQHLEIKNQKAVIDNTLGTAYLDAELHSQKKIQERLKVAEKNENIAFMCIQSMGSLDKDMKLQMLDWLNQRIHSGLKLQ